VRLQEIADAADRVGGAGREVDLPVAVVVDREAPVRPGHELRNADRPGVRAFHAQRIDFLIAREHEVVFQLAAEVGAPLGVVEGERGEGVDDPIRADVAAEGGLDADYADDDVLGHSVFVRGALERFGVAGPELRRRL